MIRHMKPKRKRIDFNPILDAGDEDVLGDEGDAFAEKMITAESGGPRESENFYWDCKLCGIKNIVELSNCPNCNGSKNPFNSENEVPQLKTIDQIKVERIPPRNHQVHKIDKGESPAAKVVKVVI
jgi:hypothetical protein